MIIELKEIKLKKGDDLFKMETYPEPGMYVVDDGVMCHIVQVPEGKNAGVMTMLVPVEDIKRHARIEADNESRESIESIFMVQAQSMEGIIRHAINDITTLLKERQDRSPYSDNIDGNTLLKAIAIAQDSQLSKELIKE